MKRGSLHRGAGEGEARLLAAVGRRADWIADLTSRLVRIPSENPPGDTRALVAFVRRVLADTLPEAAVSVHRAAAPIDNVVAVLRGRTTGRRLVFNGHLDTYPAGDPSRWTYPPFSGKRIGGRIYGRGAADMKGGIACSLAAMRALAENRDLWCGELILALAGDEESMGVLGSQHLLDSVEAARGDAMICGDVGSPRVPRFGEKGMIWIDVHATGVPAHGAHVHRGVNAIDRLCAAMAALASLRGHPVATPPRVDAAIEAARAVSEPLGGDGEGRVLRQVSVNFGRIEGGVATNLVADSASLAADLRIPVGVGVAELESKIEELLGPLPGIDFEIRRRYEASWTDPEHPVVAATVAACERVVGAPVARNMRVGASDARLYRAAGVPSVVCGLTPHNLGGPDEYAEVAELLSLAGIHALAAAAFLAG